MSSVVFPELSRTFMARSYNPSENDEELKGVPPPPQGRKRKRPLAASTAGITDEKAAFVVKDGIGGIGMYASRNISCGSFIITCEDPLVSTHRTTATKNSGNFCRYCVAPLGGLRDHLGASLPADEDLPVSRGTDDDLCFTPGIGNDKDGVLECKDCRCAAWCSGECAKKGRRRHRFLCQKGNNTSIELDKFIDFVAGESSIFLLAVDAVSLILDVALEQWQGCESDDVAVIDCQKLCFFKDFGAHPLWWEVGDASKADGRKAQTLSFVRLLRNFFTSNCQGMGLAKEDEHLLVDRIIPEMCTPENIGNLLGMYQCNVMEFEYPSPLEQYLDALDDECEEEDEDDEDKGGSECDNNQEKADDSALDGEKRLQENMASLREQGNVIGSGLYPLLTLANHDCDPNASIDFIRESNSGSMIALRDIAEGEEICITYVPNGDLDAGGTAERWRHHEPTRTWKWLNQQQNEGDNADDESDDGSHCTDVDEQSENESEDGRVGVESGEEAADGDNLSTQPSDDEDELEDCGSVEGASRKDRSVALFEYGFECQCRRCAFERNSTEPYLRGRGPATL